VRGFKELLDEAVKAIDALRVEQGLTQQQMADTTGKHECTVNSFLNRRYSDASVKTLVQMAAGVDADVEIRIVPRPKVKPWPGRARCEWSENGTAARFACQCGADFLGNVGEVSGIRREGSPVLELWTTQGGGFGTELAIHVRACPLAAAQCRMEYC
jgi:transcriptional regulator with XRE-family HTH domain